MTRNKLALVAVLVLSLITLQRVVACNDGNDGDELQLPTFNSDEWQVWRLVTTGLEAWNTGDSRTTYEMYSPNYRQTASYLEFKDYFEMARDETASLYGTTKAELVGDVNVMVVREWAWAAYKVRIGNIIVSDKTGLDGADIYRKVAGKWYDVEEDRFALGHNEDDLPDLR